MWKNKQIKTGSEGIKAKNMQWWNVCGMQDERFLTESNSADENSEIFLPFYNTSTVSSYCSQEVNTVEITLTGH